MGALAAYAVVGSSKLAQAAVLKDGGAPGASDPAAANLPVKRFNIPAGPLDAGIAAYEQQTGLKVKTSLPAATIAGFQTKGVTGLLPEEEALQVLLEGTGLQFVQEDSTTMTVGLRNSESVNVTATLPDSVAMSKFTEPLLDTPQTITVVPQFVLRDEQNRSLMDAVRNVPGISIAAGEAGAQGDNLTIRGFTARNDIFLDGIRDFGSYYRDSFNFEQVEVLEGPAGVQFGRGSTGGVINQESKAPAADQFVNVQAQFGTDLTRRVTADINQPLPDLAKGAAFRVAAVATEGGVAGRPFAENRRFGVAPSLTFGLNSPTRFTISYLHFTESDTPDYGLPWLLNGLAPGAPRHAYYGFSDANYIKTNDDVVTGKLNHSFSENVEVHSIARWANYPRQALITEPQVCGNPAASVPVGTILAASAVPKSSVTGAICPYTQQSNPSTILVNRNQLNIKSVEGELWDQTEASFRFKVAGLRHTLVTGVEGGQEISNPIRTSYTINNLNTVPSATLVDPNTSQPFGGTAYVTSVVHTKSKSVGLYFIDTMKLGRLFEVSGGVRWDRFDTGYNLYTPGPPPAGGTVTVPVAPISRIDEQPTYRAALVYKPSSHGSVYFDYGTSFNPAAESLSLSVGLANGSAVPEQNETYELGTKWSLLHDHLKAELALFRTEKDNARETDPTNSNNIVAAGNQLVRGIQMSVVGQLPHGMDLIAGYAYLDSETIYSKFFPTSVGYQLANVPKNTFNMFITRRLGLNVTGGLGGNYVAARTASSTVPYVPTGYQAQNYALGAAPCGTTVTTCYIVTGVAMKQVPGYWVFNAMLKRPITDKIELQANVYNLLNRFYIDQPHPSHLIPVAGLNAQFGVNFKF